MFYVVDFPHGASVRVLQILAIRGVRNYRTQTANDDLLFFGYVMEHDDNADDLFSCAICGLSEGDSSNLTTQNTLQTNATVGCGHQLYVLKRVTLSTRTLDDVQCEKDTSWRRRILKIFNKSEKDFPTLLEYNNYLEEVEDISNIVNEEPNAEEAKAKVKAYEEANRSQIVIRQSQRADEERCIADRIASEQREAERRKREFQEIERAVCDARRKFKQETTEVMLGERDQVSAEVAAAQMLGYRNELIRQQRGRGGQMPGAGPRVREPEGGLGKDKVKDREMYRKRQAAGGGVTSENIAVQERDWQLTVASLFARPRQ
ncbi:hypothetical protein ACHAXA_008214 [Cyclostephanos tholiformis]|uniref:MAT1 centre domain-containing protein n=1 Tax=Cyclostephanos tholiformis TaxID=382380 RepID=A0ABD3SCS5_9STRA